LRENLREHFPEGTAAGPAADFNPNKVEGNCRYQGFEQLPCNTLIPGEGFQKAAL
jgi:hypothetical protein